MKNSMVNIQMIKADAFMYILKLSNFLKDQLLPPLLDSTHERIANGLYIASSTFENHATSIYAKLGVSNRIELLRMSFGLPIENLEEPEIYLEE